MRLADQGKNKEVGQATVADPYGSTLSLTEDEIAGNLFLVTGAGFDTIANTMSYAAVLMAAYPDKQAWMQDELDRVFGGSSTGLTEKQRADRLALLDYTTVYPQLVRCLAFMFETLRLFPAVLHLSRGVKVNPTNAPP